MNSSKSKGSKKQRTTRVQRARPAARRSPRRKQSRQPNAYGGMAQLPLSFSKPMMNPPASTQRFTGSEIVAFPVVTTADLTGELMFEFDINPTIFPDTRLSRQAGLWDMYQVKNFMVELIPSVPFTIAGSYVLAIDPDPLADYAGMTGANRIKALSNVPGGGVFQLFSPALVSLRTRRQNEWLFCNPSQTESYKTMAGVAACALVSPLAGATGSIQLTMKISYDILFQGQNLAEPTQSDLTQFSNTPGRSMTPTGTSFAEVLLEVGVVDPAFGLNYNQHIYIVTGSSVIRPPQAALIDTILAEWNHAVIINLGGTLYAKFYPDYASAKAGQGSAAMPKSLITGSDPLITDTTPLAEGTYFVQRIIE